MRKSIQKVISILLILTFIIPSTMVFAEEPETIINEALQETIFYAEEACILPAETATDSIVKVVSNGDINTLPVPNSAFTERENEIVEVQSSIFSNTQSRIEQDVYGQSTAYYMSNQLSINAFVVSKDTLTVNTSVLQTQPDDFAVLVSQQGDITLSSAQMTYQGILYAPNGTVTINASDSTFSGVIIAKNIVIKAPNATFSYNARVEDYLSNDIETDPLPTNIEIYEKPLNSKDIMIDEATGIQYVKGQILLTATEGVTKVEVAEMVKPYQGRIAGYISATNDYQIVLDKANTKVELEKVITQLEQDERVMSVLLHWVFENELTATAPNDPWVGLDAEGNQISPEGWDEANPSGSNWGLEATKVLSAWEKQADMKPVKVGVIDSGIHNHEDLNPKLKLNMSNWTPPVVNPKDSIEKQRDDYGKRNHGTHVTGIIGATANNGKGISGVAPNAELYSTAILQAQAFTTKRCLAELVVRDVKVINHSIGASAGDIIDGSITPESRHQYFNDFLSNFLEKLIDAGYDFLIVQASGNDSNILGSNDKKKWGWADSRYSGCFNNLDNPEVNKHIIVVGAYGTTGNQDYHVWSRSQIGDRVDILAPGEGIASLVEKNETFIMNGTSMAAPHVTGVAAMVWGINPNLTAEQVKEILISTATDKINVVRNNADVKDYLLSGEVALNRGYPRLDAAAAVIRAEKEIGQGTSNPKDTGVLMGKLVFPEGLDFGTDAPPSIQLEAYQVNGEKVALKATQSIFSDAEGEFFFILPKGEYLIKMTSTSFQMPNVPDESGTITICPFSMQETVKPNQIKYLEKIQLIEGRRGNPKTQVTGTLKNAIGTAHAVPNATITIRKNWNTFLEQEDNLKCTTDKNGQFIIDLYAGYYTAMIEKEGFITDNITFTVFPNEKQATRFLLSPKMKEDEIRIVSSWSREGWMTGYVHVKTFLGDEDNPPPFTGSGTSANTPATTFEKRDDIIYTYFVHNGWGEIGDMMKYDMMVTVYLGNDSIEKYYFSQGLLGRFWIVFDIKGDEITPINTVTNTMPQPFQ